jgi:hypothetical protein
MLLKTNTTLLELEFEMSVIKFYPERDSNPNFEIKTARRD